MDIPTPPVDATAEMWQLEQLMWWVLDRSVNHVEEQVKYIESLVQDKMPTNPREEDSTPAINHTWVGRGSNTVMGEKAPSLSIFSREESPTKHESLYKQWMF